MHVQWHDVPLEDTATRAKHQRYSLLLEYNSFMPMSSLRHGKLANRTCIGADCSAVYHTAVQRHRPENKRAPPARSRARFANHIVALAQPRAAQHASSGAIIEVPDDQRIRKAGWPQKSAIYLLRTDGKSCSRELVTGTGKLRFAYPSTQQHLLVWRNRPKSVLVLKKLGEELNEPFLQVVQYLAEVEGLRVVVEPAMYASLRSCSPEIDYVFTFAKDDTDRLSEFVDFVVCLGGDGVILHASSLFTGAMPPIISFHLGSMGFLTNHGFNNFAIYLREVIYGCQKLDTCSMDGLELNGDGNTLGVMVTLRMRLRCEVYRSGSYEPEQVYEVLNEVVLDRGSNPYLTNIECYERGRFITRVQADGVMLATPTGSTAYSCAAGGSMVHPNVAAILLTPICPHSLNFRPIILPDYAELELRVPDNARTSAWLSFDGKHRQELHHGDSLVVKMSENPVPTINKADLTGDWFDSLERCFRWSDRMEQRPLDLATQRSLALAASPARAAVGAVAAGPAAPGLNGANGAAAGIMAGNGNGATAPQPPPVPELTTPRLPKPY